MSKAKIIGILIIIAIISFYGGYLISNLISSYSPTIQTSKLGNITIIDSSGKYVEISIPVKKIVVLTGDAATILKILNASDLIVGISDVIANKPEIFGNISNKTVVGSWKNPDYEKIISLKPDIVITYTKWTLDAEEKLEPLGIKVVRFDFYIPSIMDREIKTLAIIIGREKEAESLCKWMKDILNIVNQRLSGLKEENKLRAYGETYITWGTVGPGAGLYDIMILSGLRPIGEFSISYPKVSAEWVINENPDVIIKAITADPLTIKQSDYEKILNDIKQRLNLTNAVKQNKIVILPNDLLYKPSYPIAILQIAKISYPDRFSDIDVSYYLKQYLSFLGIEYKGIWYYPS
ncbi:MAG: hypothetical protein DSO09_04610 [Candidatus Methanomethylicota archaeon]|uniref:ABC transporter substrate-binding protein n=1 Tax=Thermoproteota archaeon TaxID=2056631 RepID=A0A520KGW7_9CREN|nr:MAG: ABC transporter substrate-binding protein [Candidatus Verstraetearchaeota archaeon]TDA38358.1 MAG: hypothetical protein DSO09_04610 [Candidatus Verstraetearchaeota archaeon]